ncbi:MAG: NAD(P)H-dependent dehydrogenase/reductase, partial [Proteobacteria bacterium]|nr:NAD(P)H-dependent dehydrogenase/reductase [Pseudomonadota bacterium]
MFDFLIETRRSIRKFKQQAVEPEKIEKLVEAALRAPSSMSRNPWEFIVVTEPELLAKLARSKEHGSSFLKNSPLAIVVCADPQKCDVWVEDASIASIFIHLAAHDLGLGSCWIQIRDRMHDGSITAEEYVRQILAIPENLKVESIVAIGYPDEQKDGHPKDQL